MLHFRTVGPTRTEISASFAQDFVSIVSLIDSHVHVDHARFDLDRSEVIERARNAGVVAQVVPAVSRRLWPRVRAACAGEPDLFACYGLHPCFFDQHDDDDLRELADWLGRERAVAVGECGLDYFVAGADKAQQQQWFAGQLSLAREFDLPIVIHARKAVEDVIRMIRASGHYKGVIHSYSGSAQQAARLVDLGYRLSFGGAVTYPRATRLRAVVATLPIDALLLETDAPDQPDAAHAGERNEPAFVTEVIDTIAELRDESREELAERTTHNAIDLFALPERVRDTVSVFG